MYIRKTISRSVRMNDGNETKNTTNANETEHKNGTNNFLTNKFRAWESTSWKQNVVIIEICLYNTPHQIV